MNLRAIRTLLYIVFYIIFSTPTRIRLRNLAKTDPKQSNDLAGQEIQKVMKKLLAIAGAEVEVDGLQNIPEEACLYVGNHSSYFDIVTLGASIPGTTGFVAKDSLAKIPGLASWMRLIHCLFLDRSDIKKGLETIMTGVGYLKDGYCMCIYPEGTRSKTGQMGEFKGGALKMAQRAKAPVVPVAVTGSRDIFENNPGLQIKPARVQISFGQPFVITDLPAAERKFAADYTKDTIQNLLDKHQKKC